MRRDKTWPTRKTQFIVVALLALGALAQVFLPLVTKHGRAEALYEEAWSDWSAVSHRASADMGSLRAVEKMEAALRLDPGNSLYEQTLVWHWDWQRLPELLKQRKLGPTATRLATWLTFAAELRHAEVEDSRSPRLDAVRIGDGDAARLLARLDALGESEPSNALVGYEKAYVLFRAGRMDEACAAIEAASRAGRITLPVPEVSKAARGSSAYYSRLSLDIGSYHDFHPMVRALVNVADERLRHGQVGGACRLLEACYQSGIDLSCAKPESAESVLVGGGLLWVGRSHLIPIYKDFGMKDRVAALKKADAAMDRASEAIQAAYPQDSVSAIASAEFRTNAVPMALIGSTLAAAIVFAAATLCGLFAATFMKLRKEQLPKAPPWGQGWLARIFLAVFVPLAAVLAGLVLTVTPARAESSMTFAAYGGMAAICLCEVVLLVLVLKRLHRASEESTGERTGILRLIFRTPAAWKAWTLKYVMAAMLGQLVFIGCCFAMATIIYKPLVGAHPWETSRISHEGIPNEQALVTRAIAGMEGVKLVR